MVSGVVITLLLLIVLLAIPVTLTYRVSWQQDFQSDIKLQWAFGLVRVRLSPFQSKTPSPESKKSAQKSRRVKRSPSKNSNFIAVFWRKAFRRRIIRFIRDIWKAVRKRNVSLRLRLGLGDPADTGQLWAIIGPMAGILTNTREASINIEPEFLDATFELDSSGDIRLIPLQMIYLTIALFLSPSVWRGIKQMGKGK